MRVNVHEILEQSGIAEKIYPGKRVIKRFVQPGEHKSHCAVFDWTQPEQLRFELLPGVSGKPLPANERKHYPISFQAETYMDIIFVDAEDSDDEDEEGGSKGKSGGGGKKPKESKKLEDTTASLKGFARAMEGVVPTEGDIKKFVVMGKEIAKEAYGKALDNLTHQLQQAKVLAMDILKGTTDIIQRATPGGGLEAKGDEAIKYKYDVERTGPMFGALTP